MNADNNVIFALYIESTAALVIHAALKHAGAANRLQHMRTYNRMATNDAEAKSAAMETTQQRSSARESAAVQNMIHTEMMEVYRYFTWFQINNLHFVYGNYDFRHQCSTIVEAATRLRIRDQVEKLIQNIARAAESTESEETDEEMPFLEGSDGEIHIEPLQATVARLENRAVKKQRILDAIELGKQGLQQQLIITPTDYCDATAGYDYAHGLPTGFTQLSDVKVETGEATVRDWSTLWLALMKMKVDWCRQCAVPDHACICLQVMQPTQNTATQANGLYKEKSTTRLCWPTRSLHWR